MMITFFHGLPSAASSRSKQDDVALGGISAMSMVAPQQDHARSDGEVEANEQLELLAL